MEGAAKSPSSPRITFFIWLNTVNCLFLKRLFLFKAPHILQKFHAQCSFHFLGSRSYQSCFPSCENMVFWWENTCLMLKLKTFGNTYGHSFLQRRKVEPDNSKWPFVRNTTLKNQKLSEFKGSFQLNWGLLPVKTPHIYFPVGSRTFRDIEELQDRHEVLRTCSKSFIKMSD